MSETPKKQRRQRAVLSCDDCRRRKLQCDRELPCKRCIKGGIADSCSYKSDPQDRDSEEVIERPKKRQRQVSTPQATSNVRNILQTGGRVNKPDIARSDISAELRIKELEEQVYGLQRQLILTSHEHEKHVTDYTQSSRDIHVEQPAWMTGILKGHHYATFSYGPSSGMSIMTEFPDLRDFMRDIYQNSTARRLAQDMKAFEERARSDKSSYRVLSITSLRDLFPDRAIVDVLIRTYLNTFEKTFRIVHVPSFQAAYNCYWDLEQKDGMDMDALIIAIMACTLCISNHESPRYCHNGSTFHIKAVLWIKACETWLKRLSNKHRTLTSIQVRCLRLLALSVTSHKRKEYYQEVQAHLGLMRASGMHRDPAIAGKRCSPFEGEMRRRLWATSVELELQASIDKGTSSILSSFEYDCTAPLNIDDSAIQVNSEELPDSQPTSIFTDSSYLHLSAQTIDTRVRLCARLNSLKTNLTFHETLSTAEIVQRCLEELPIWTDPESLQPRTLLDLQLRQFIILLHIPRALQNGLVPGPEYQYSAIAALEASAAVIDLHTDLVGSSNFALCCTRNDYHRAAMLTCHIAFFASKNNNVMMSQVAKVTLDGCVRKALALQEECATRLGRGAQAYWYLSAALGLVGLQYDPLQSTTMKLQAVDRISRLYYKMLSLLDEPTEQSLASEVVLEDHHPTVPQLNATSTESAEPLSVESFVDAGLRLDAFDLGGASEWMLDDFWFLDSAPPNTSNDQPHYGF